MLGRTKNLLNTALKRTAQSQNASPRCFWEDVRLVLGHGDHFLENCLVSLSFCLPQATTIFNVQDDDPVFLMTESHDWKMPFALVEVWTDAQWEHFGCVIIESHHSQPSGSWRCAEPSQTTPRRPCFHALIWVRLSLRDLTPHFLQDEIPSHNIGLL